MSEVFAEQRKKEIAENPILVYGKGTKLMPMCGFTANVVGMFQELGKPFSLVNVLDDEAIIRCPSKARSAFATTGGP